MSPRRIRNGVIAAAIGFGATTAAFAAGELRFSTRATELGELDLYRYCTEMYEGRALAVLLAWDAYGWNCAVQARVLVFKKADFDEACRLQYGKDDAVARTSDARLPFAWRCYVA